MNIIDLNTDVQLIIFKHISNSIQNLNLKMLLLNEKYNNYFIKQIAINRIKLFYKIISQYKMLKKYILFRLDLIFGCKSRINSVSKPYFIHKQYNCFFYAPVIKNGRCRFCLSYEKQHIFSEKFICQYYLPLIN